MSTGRCAGTAARSTRRWRHPASSLNRTSGIKGGVSVGETDELGAAAVKDRFAVKHLHATILNQLGLDPERLTYFHSGLQQKLVGVEGADPIRQIIA